MEARVVCGRPWRMAGGFDEDAHTLMQTRMQMQAQEGE